MATKARKTVRRKAAPKRKPARKVVRRVRTGRAVAARKRALSTLRRKVSAAARLSKAFHGRKPTKVTAARRSPVVVGMVLGKLTAVLYRRPDGQEYMHEFRGGAQPTLAATHDGRRLIVQGGRYRMTDRGIVDKRK